MLIYFYSDRNHILSGFEATYNVTICPFNCNGHGICNERSHMCTCDFGWGGIGCDQQVCPDVCNSHGTCNNNRCTCDPGYAGYDCKLVSTPTKEGKWYTVEPGYKTFGSRAGHTAVFSSRTNSLYVYGGTTFNGLSTTLMRYFFTGKYDIVL